MLINIFKIKLYIYFIFFRFFTLNHACLKLRKESLSEWKVSIFENWWKSLDDDQTYWSWQIRAWIKLCSVLIHIRYPLSAWSKTILFYLYQLVLIFLFFRYNDAIFSVPTTKHLQIKGGVCIHLQMKSLSL